MVPGLRMPWCPPEESLVRQWCLTEPFLQACSQVKGTVSSWRQGHLEEGAEGRRAQPCPEGGGSSTGPGGGPAGAPLRSPPETCRGQGDLHPTAWGCSRQRGHRSA